MGINKSLTINWELFENINELPKSIQDLFVQAFNVQKKAYAPYSKFSVGAAIKTDANTVITGSNQENKAYPSGLCAERVALFYAGANYPDEKITDVVLVGDGEMLTEGAVFSPCGACRQVMVETQRKHKESFKVWILQADGRVFCIPNAMDLIPFSFGDERVCELNIFE
jgi:cytidine deaminase